MQPCGWPEARAHNYSPPDAEADGRRVRSRGDGAVAEAASRVGDKEERQRSTRADKGGLDESVCLGSG